MTADGALNAVFGLLDFIYGRPWVAPFVILPSMLVWAIIVHVTAIIRTRPYLRAAEARRKALISALGNDPDPISERAAFSHNFADVARVLGDESGGAAGIAQAWREFHESIIDESATPIRNTGRPHPFFTRAAPKQTQLVFWSNVFIGLGLILTFLGLIVALNKAAGGMRGGDVQAAQGALIGLLTVAGAKFFTSVGGLVASLWLRFGEHRLTRAVNQRTEAICSLLERGLLYVPAQKIAVEQLEILREQRDELKSFNTDLALQIGERVGAQFQAAIAPVAASLNTLNESMASVTQGIGDGARKAIEEVSGDQLRGLSNSLAQLGSRLDTLTESVGRSGDGAAENIREAAALFIRAASDMQDAFTGLAGRVDNLGVTLTGQSDAAIKAQTETLESAIKGFETIQRQSADTMSSAVASLKEASQTAATTMQSELGGALKRGVEDSQAVFRSAVEESGQGLRDAASGISQKVTDAAAAVERAAAGFERSGQAAAQTALAMNEVSKKTEASATALDEASTNFKTAATPINQSARAIEVASNEMKRAVEATRDANSQAMDQVTALSNSMKQTHAAAETAWKDYKARFEGLDNSLEGTLRKLADTLRDMQDKFLEFTQKADSQLGSAVSKLGTSMSAVEEYAETLDQYVELSRRQSKVPAE